MDIISIIMLSFAILGAIDRVFNNRLGLGKEFEKGFMLLSTLAITMIGMIVISPLLAKLLEPCFAFLYNTFKIDPSIITSSLFANDMGGASLAKEVAKNSDIGLFNGLVVASMMGATISFTIPFALGSVSKEKHKELMLGFLCGIVTIPVGCFFAGLISNIPLGLLLLNLLPLLIFALIVAVGLMYAPQLCIKIFNVIGFIMKVLITIGLCLGMLEYLIDFKPIKGLASFEEGARICLNGAIVLSGAFPLLHILSKLLKKPLKKVGTLLNVNEKSTVGFLGTLATSVSTFEMMSEMDSKGAVLNSAFAVSAAFLLAGHLAFTIAFDAAYLWQMMLGKLISGIFAILFAQIVYKRIGKNIANINL